MSNYQLVVLFGPDRDNSDLFRSIYGTFFLVRDLSLGADGVGTSNFGIISALFKETSAFKIK